MQSFRPLQPFLHGNLALRQTDGQTHRSTYRGGAGAHLKMRTAKSQGSDLGGLVGGADGGIGFE